MVFIAKHIRVFNKITDVVKLVTVLGTTYVSFPNLFHLDTLFTDPLKKLVPTVSF